MVSRNAVYPYRVKMCASVSLVEATGPRERTLLTMSFIRSYVILVQSVSDHR